MVSADCPSVIAAMLGLIERQHVVGRLANGAQDSPAFDRQRLDQLFGEVRGRQQRHDTEIGGRMADCESDDGADCTLQVATISSLAYGIGA
jgi:hypothetical protein